MPRKRNNSDTWSDGTSRSKRSRKNGSNRMVHLSKDTQTRAPVSTVRAVKDLKRPKLRRTLSSDNIISYPRSFKKSINELKNTNSGGSSSTKPKGGKGRYRSNSVDRNHVSKGYVSRVLSSTLDQRSKKAEVSRTRGGKMSSLDDGLRSEGVMLLKRISKRYGIKIEILD